MVHTLSGAAASLGPHYTIELQALHKVGVTPGSSRTEELYTHALNTRVGE